MAKIKDLLDLIDKLTPDVKAAFLEAIADIKDNIDVNRVMEAFKAGDITAAVQALGIEPAAFRPLTRALETAFETGGIFTMSQFPRNVTGAIWRFDVRDSMAEAWLRDYSSQLITRVTNEQKSIVQSLLQNGVAEGTGPKNMVVDLVGHVTPQGRVGGVLGLNKPQADALMRAKTELRTLDSNYFSRELRDQRFDSTVQKAIDSGTPLTAEQVEKLSTRYSDNLLKWRAETVARTETISALNQSQQQSVNQLLESGQITEQDAMKEWDAVEDTFIGGKGHTRKSHVDMNGQKVRVNEPYITPEGARLMYPGDTSLGAPPEETINCRCRSKLVIDWIGAAKRNKR